jgi:invasion protein IalB
MVDSWDGTIIDHFDIGHAPDPASAARPHLIRTRRMRMSAALLSAILALGVPASTAIAQAQAPRPQAQPAPAQRAPAAPAQAAPEAAPGPAAPAPVSPDPDRTTASFGDWLLRCERVAEAERSCEVAQVIAVQGSQQPIAQIALGRTARTQTALTLLVQVPVNVELGTPLRLIGDDREPLIIETNWRRCIPAGCFAGVELRDEVVVRRLRDRPEPMRIEFRDTAGRDLRLAFSVRGLGPALDALARE